jgi:alanine dehydrogenase
MRIGVPTEVKPHERRVAVTSAAAHELVVRGHEVVVQAGAGAGSRIADAEYEAAGARIVPSAADAWDADLVLKVKEPMPEEHGFLREGLTLFTYLHLAADRALTDALLASGTTAIAYETVQRPDRSLPLLAPMSMIAGRLAAQVAAYHLMAPLGGRGVLMGGVPGTTEAKVVILGGGQVGEQAALISRGLRAEVTVVDLSLDRLMYFSNTHHGEISTRYSTTMEIARQVAEADVVVGSVLVPGARAPKLVTHEMVETMKPGALLVDVAIDQGGCFADSRPTTHDHPTFTVADTVFYCVTNMPGSVPVTATTALGNATLPYALRLADLGWCDALRADPSFAKGLQTQGGRLTSAPVAEAHGLEHDALEDVLA